MGKRGYWPNWVDCLGQEYKVGDTVAIATNGAGPEIVVGVVKSINSTTKEGEPIFAGFGTNRHPSCSVTVDNIIRSGNQGNPLLGRRPSYKTQTYDSPWRIVKLRSGASLVSMQDAIEELRKIELTLRTA